jgi:CHAT domain-containing protein/tetratricopeptide (TPR) repeat protein
MLALLLAIAVQDPEPPDLSSLPVLRLGETTEGEITDSAHEVHTPILDTGGYAAAATVGVEYRIVVEESGPYHIDLRSHDFDAYLVLRDGSGSVLAEDDDGLIGAQARIAGQLTSEITYSVEVCALHGERGAFELSLAAGLPPDLDPEERARATRADARERVAAAEERFGPEHPATARSLSVLAELLWRDGDYEAARGLYGRVLGIEEQVLNPDDPDLQITRENLALALKNLGDLAGVRKLREQVLAARSRTLPAEHPDLQRARGNLAKTLYSLGDFDGARRLQEQVLAVHSRTLPDDHPHLQIAREYLAHTLHALGDFDGARELQEQALDVRSRTLPPEHPNLLIARGNLAATLSDLGDFVGARELEEQVLKTFSRTLPPEHPDLQIARINLSVTLQDLGDLDGARELQEQVLEVLSRTVPAEHPNLQGARHNLASTLEVLGDLDGARELQEQVLEAFSRTLPAEHPKLQAARGNLALTLRALGDRDGARELQEQVLEALSRTLPAEHPNLQAARGNLSVTLRALGDLDGARELQEQVLALLSRTLPAEHPNLQHARSNLAGTLHALRELEDARELQEQVLAVRSRTLPSDHADLQSARYGLATTLYTLGDLDGARELQEHVLGVHSRTLPADHPHLQATRHSLAITLYTLGDLDGARELVAALLGSVRTRARALHEESPRVARAGARQQLRFVLAALPLSASPDGPPALTSELFAALESLRSVSLVSPAVAHALGDHPELADLQLEIVRLRTGINNHVPLGPNEGQSTDDWREGLLELSTERDALQRKLRQALAQAGFATPEITAASVATAMPSGAAAISYLRVPRGSPIHREAGEKPASVDSLVAFVVLTGGAVERVDLGSAAEIEESARQWRAALGKPIERGVGIVTGEGIESKTGATLRERILDPVLALAGDVRVLHVVLDDFLHLVPLEALPAGSTEKDGHVGDRLHIQYEVSFGRLVSGARPPLAEGTLLALGGVDFDATSEEQDVPASSDSSDRSGLLDSFEPLRQTRYEVEDIAAQYEEAFETEPVLLQMADADKEALRTLAPSARWLHLATHGWFAPETLRSQLDLSDDETQRASLLRAQETVRGFAPEALCGLALAGANGGRNAVGRLPGIITAEELSTLDLRNCELAVLSACETNVGIRRAGQGIQSLQTALHAAGARTAITSLWKVDDAATRRLFEIFYTKLWKEKLGKADALWQAKMALRSEGHPVRDWAGWVLTGDPD